MLNNPVIAISGKSGCGNSTVSSLVAGKLGLSVINYTFKSIAEERGISFDEVCRLAEVDDSYDRLVDTKQVALAEKGGCVLGSRLAIWLLKHADLTVYLDASLPVRAARILKREGGTLEETMERTRRRDARDSARYNRLYGIDTDQFGFADLVISAEGPSPYEIADTIVSRLLESRESQEE